MKKNTKNKQWNATHLRITVFPTSDFKDNPEKLWPDIEGISLEESKTKPKTLESVLEGSYNNQMIILAVLPIKFDLMIKASNELGLDSSSLPTIPNIGDFSESLSNFNTIAESWLTQIDISSFKRIAFGTELIRSVSNTDEGYKQLSELLPFPINAKDTTDFNLQINKPIIHKVNANQDLKINRLTTWDVLRRKLQVATPDDIQSSFKYPDAYYCHLVMDINTAPNQGDFNKEKSLDLYTSLIEYGTTISNKGIK